VAPVVAARAALLADVMPSAVVVRRAAAPPPPPPPPLFGHWHVTAGGWRGCLPAPVPADAVALAVWVLERIWGEDGLLSLMVRGVVARP